MPKHGTSLTEPRKSLVGNKYHKLTVKSLYQYIPKKDGKNRKIYWLCDCDCGSLDVIAEHSNLITGCRKSCGCMRLETLKKMWDGNSKEDSFLNAIIREYKSNAKKRNLNFELTKEEFLELIKGRCTYCNCEPYQHKKIFIRNKHSKNSFLFNGIDRIDSSEGYTKENSTTCCRRCNLAKSDMTLSEFLNWIKLTYEYNYNPQPSIKAKLSTGLM